MIKTLIKISSTYEWLFNLVGALVVAIPSGRTAYLTAGIGGAILFSIVGLVMGSIMGWAAHYAILDLLNRIEKKRHKNA